MAFTEREQIIEVANRLFVYTDQREWEKLQKEVFTSLVHFDIRSIGGQEGYRTAKEICEGWAEDLLGLDAVHHQAGNYLVEIQGAEARVMAYSMATHFKASATKGKTRTFVGSYLLGLEKGESGWRINAFRYQLKYSQGNLDLL